MIVFVLQNNSITLITQDQRGFLFILMVNQGEGLTEDQKTIMFHRL